MMNQRLPNLTMNLRLKWMWMRHTYTFNWAHKPLCDRFKSGVFRIDKLHICRSCVFAYIGISFGIVTGLLYPSMITDLKLTILALILTPVIILSYPRLYKKLTRFLQDILRLTMGMIIGFVPFFLIYQNFLCGFTSMVVLLVFWRIYFHQRKVRKLHACDGCPELDLPEICSGFQQQASAIRLYEIEATDFIYHNGCGYPN